MDEDDPGSALRYAEIAKELRKTECQEKILIWDLHKEQLHFAFFYFFKFIYFWPFWVLVAVLRLSLDAESRHYSPVSVCRLLISAASLVVEPRL